jgi:hypothetical protein
MIKPHKGANSAEVSLTSLEIRQDSCGKLYCFIIKTSTELPANSVKAPAAGIEPWSALCYILNEPIRACLKTVKTPKQRISFCQTAL